MRQQNKSQWIFSGNTRHISNYIKPHFPISIGANGVQICTFSVHYCALGAYVYILKVQNQ